MQVKTGHKTFDQQTNCITTGNVFANTQKSLYIRSYNTTTCNGLTFPKGHLRNWDLNLWIGLPKHVKAAVLEHTSDDSVILYEFFHRNHNRKITHGYVITRPDGTLLCYFVTGPTYKSWHIIDECMKHIVRKKEEKKAV